MQTDPLVQVEDSAATSVWEYKAEKRPPPPAGSRVACLTLGGALAFAAASLCGLMMSRSAVLRAVSPQSAQSAALRGVAGILGGGDGCAADAWLGAAQVCGACTVRTRGTCKGFCAGMRRTCMRAGRARSNTSCDVVKGNLSGNLSCDDNNSEDLLICTCSPDQAQRAAGEEACQAAEGLDVRTPTAVATVQGLFGWRACNELCLWTSGCGVWTYETVTGQCFMHRLDEADAATATRSIGFVSGRPTKACLAQELAEKVDSPMSWLHGVVRSRHSGRCLDVVAGRVRTLSCLAFSERQAWSLRRRVGQLRHRAGLCLDAGPRDDQDQEEASSPLITIKPCDTENLNQRWDLLNATGHLRSRRWGLCLEASASTSEEGGAAVEMRRCADDDKLEQWSLVPLGSTSASAGASFEVGQNDSAPTREGTPAASGHGVPRGTGAGERSCMVHEDVDVSTSTEIATIRGIFGWRACNELCLRTGGCGVWTWKNVTGQCFLRQNDAADDAFVTPSSGLVSGQPSTACLAEELAEDVDAPVSWSHGFILNRHNGKCLDVLAGRVRTWTCLAGNERQAWSFRRRVGQLRHSAGLCLDAGQHESSRLTVKPCDTKNADQRWDFLNETFHIRSRRGSCVEANASTSEGGAVELRTCAEDNELERWNFVQLRSSEQIARRRWHQ